MSPEAHVPDTRTAVQKAQRRASIGISLRHYRHFRVVGSSGGWRLRSASSRFIGRTTK